MLSKEGGSVRSQAVVGGGRMQAWVDGRRRFVGDKRLEGGG